MTINARLDRYPSNDDIAKELATLEFQPHTGPIKAQSFGDPRDGFLIRLVGFHPKSMEGRTILLRLNENDRDELLRTLRREAVRARSVTT